MEPGDNSQRPQRGQAPYPRYRGAVDGFRVAPRQPQSVPPPAPQPAQPPAPQAAPQPLPQQQPSWNPQPPVNLPPVAPVAPVVQPQFQQPAPAVVPPTPPPAPEVESVSKKPRRSRRPGKRFAIVSLAMLLLLLAGGLYGLFRYQAAQNSPDKVFRAALESSLQTSHVTVSANNARTKTTTQFDFTTLTNPTSSSQATIVQDGSVFTVAGYGTAKDTYLSYKALPVAVTKQVQSAVQDGWIQLRSNGVEPAGVPQVLAQATDPRYQTIGLVPFANINEKLRLQLLDYTASHAIYKYSKTDVLKTTYNGQSVLAYTVTPNISYLKIVALSIANSEGLPVADSEAATAQLDGLKDTKVTLYASRKAHQFIGASIAGKTVTTTLSYTYGGGTLAGEPQTKLQWKDFAPVQIQIESQTATRQTATDIDTARQTDLAAIHKSLAIYYAQNNSYPSIGNLNDQTWVAANLTGLDPASLHEPLATTTLLAPAPKAGAYAYQTQSTNAKLACDNTPANQCTHYILTAMLHTGQPTTVQDP